MHKLAILLLIIIVASCKPEAYTPKPRGYYNITFPEHTYKLFSDTRFPYSFEYPEYAEIIRDTLFFGERTENPFWISIIFPTLGGRIYLSYKIMNKDIGKLTEDAYDMTFFHTKKADYIGDDIFNIDSTNVHGLFYTVSGNAASAYQFYATDSVHHYLRGALYFDVTPNADSLKPVNEFIRKDMEHLLTTLRWKN